MVEVASGDGSAFAKLFDRHSKAVARFCFRYVGEKARAEELAQEVFVKLYRSAGSYTPAAKFRTYLFRVAANHCLNEIRRPQYRSVHEALDDHASLPADASSSPSASVEGMEVEQALRTALAAMSDRERAAFTMCRFEGLAYREIAFALQSSEAAVKSLIHRATLQVAKKIEELHAGVHPERSRA